MAKFDYSDDNNLFDPIKLCGAINYLSDYDKENHGIMSAVVEYHTPYRYLDGKPFRLTLALGNSMYSILGLPTIMYAGLEPRWKQQVYLSHTFRSKFPIEFMQTQRVDISPLE